MCLNAQQSDNILVSLPIFPVHTSALVSTSLLYMYIIFYTSTEVVGVPLAGLLILLQNKYINNYLTLGSGAHHLLLIFHRLGILQFF